MKLEKSIDKLKNGIPLTISALGDSLTYGWMVPKGYIDFLQEMLKSKYPNSRITINNRGIPGNTAEEGLYRLRSDIINADPDLVFIQFALNDAYMGCQPGRFQNNIRSIIERLRLDTEAEILLITSSYLNNETENKLAEKFYTRLENISEEEKIPIALVHKYWEKKIASGINFNSLVQADYVHPTVEGYRLMAEAIMDVF